MGREWSGSPATPEQEVLLRGGFDAGRGSHGVLGLGFDLYARQVLELTLRRLAQAGAPCTEARRTLELRQAALADLYLAIACAHGAAGSWETLNRHYVPRLAGLAERRGASRTDAEMLAQEVIADLVLIPGKSAASTRLATFDGGGTLFAWLAVILVRRLGSLRQTWQENAAILASPPSPEPVSASPVEHAETGERVQRFDAALQVGWRQLSDQERVTVLARHHDGLKQEEIALLLGVGAPRVSRIIHHAHDTLRCAIEDAFPGESWRDLGHLWSELRDQIGVRLATSAAPRPQPPHGSSPDGPPRNS